MTRGCDTDHSRLAYDKTVSERRKIERPMSGWSVYIGRREMDLLEQTVANVIPRNDDHSV